MKSMRSNQHQQFIQTPILDILRDTVTSCRAIGDGIEVHPLCEYIMQTTFLNMTGASEQKLKCICWEMATNDYEYRYELLRSPIGECSNYKDKQKIFKDMQDVISRIGPDYINGTIFERSYKEHLISNIKQQIIAVTDRSFLGVVKEKDFQQYKIAPNIIKKGLFANYDKKGKFSFLENDLQFFYERVVYRWRNRYAHNLKFYQENLPSLLGLKDGIYERENFFTMLSILVLMDELYIKLYNIYIKSLKEVKW